jgi:hypothetical protein
MSYRAIVYQVLIASPGNVLDEREAVRELVNEWNALYSYEKRIVLMPVGWETDSAAALDRRAREVINKQILEKSDLLIGVFWTRLGKPTGRGDKGIVEQIERHVKAGKPAMLYFSSKPADQKTFDSKKNARLKQFKKKCMPLGLVEDYENIVEFRDKFQKQLATTLNTNDYFTSEPVTEKDQKDESLFAMEHIVATPPSIETQMENKLSVEAMELLVEAAQDRNGIIMKNRAMGGITMETNRRSFGERGNRKSEALWEKALEGLCGAKLLADRGYKGEIFELTDAGYKEAKKLSRGKFK